MKTDFGVMIDNLFQQAVIITVFDGVANRSHTFKQCLFPQSAGSAVVFAAVVPAAAKLVDGGNGAQNRLGDYNIFDINHFKSPFLPNIIK